MHKRRKSKRNPKWLKGRQREDNRVHRYATGAHSGVSGGGYSWEQKL